MDIILGTISILMIFPAVICPPMVVTSPIGDHAPPALAASTTILAKNHRVCLSSINLRIKATITMVVVKLSSAADMKKVKTLNIHNNLILLVVLILSVIKLNP